MPSPDITRLYRARHLVTMSGPSIWDGAIAVRDGEILATGLWEQLRREHPAAHCEDLGEMILMPGLINAHCHLDYTMMRGAMFGRGGFTDWIKRLNSIRRSLDPKDYLDAIASGLSELKRWGCTTVFNIESFPEVIPFLPESPIRVWWFLEVMDIRSRLESLEALAGAIGFLEQAGEARGGFGISPHAPYTVSRDLFELSSAFALKHHLRLCTHLAESAEEMEMFRKGAGAMHGFLKEIGRSMEDCSGKTPVDLLIGGDLVPEGTLLVHMNELSREDKALLASRPGRYPVIHCPRTHAFFGRKPFDLEFFQRSGIPVLLGTDSLASNRDLDMFSEMRAMQEAFPSLDPEEILSMVTIRPAAAIGRAGRIGELSPGALADFIAIPDPGGEGSVEERILANRTPPKVWVGGIS
jgi:aminodeoxyfutalosine deaminase